MYDSFSQLCLGKVVFFETDLEALCFIGKIDIMNSIFSFKDKSVQRIPDFGPIEIINYSTFLEKSKEMFFKNWEKAMEHYSENDEGGGSVLLKNYKKLKVIGGGSFGKVYLVKHKHSRNLFAMKAISKETILKYKQLEHTKTEKLVLMSINCPFTIRMEDFFKDNTYIYFIVPFIQGGELYVHLKRSGRFDEVCSMFYVAQIVLAIEYLHFMDIVYRDIKPENILIDHTGYLKLADFGFCKHLISGRTYTLCGTPEYLAPEIILNKGYGLSVDWWGIGILMYELSAGFTPFRDKKAMKVYENILAGTYKMPNSFSENLKDLIRNILQADISKRFGNLKQGVNDIKDHKWFRPMNWQALVCRKFQPPFKPVLDSDIDTKHFRDYSYESLKVSSQEVFPEEFREF